MRADGDLEISDEKARLDINRLCGFLKRTSWALHRSRETILKSIDNSICFGAYLNGQQVAFARVVTDGCTFGYLCDVFVDEEFRGRGFSKAMMAEIVRHPELQGLRRFALATREAHGLYEKFGFQVVPKDSYMEIKNNSV